MNKAAEKTAEAPIQERAAFHREPMKGSECYVLSASTKPVPRSEDVIWTIALRTPAALSESNPLVQFARDSNQVGSLSLAQFVEKLGVPQGGTHKTKRPKQREAEAMAERANA